MAKPTETQRIPIRIDTDRELMNTLDDKIASWSQEKDSIKRMDLVINMYETIELCTGYVDTVKYHKYVQNRMYYG